MTPVSLRSPSSPLLLSSHCLLPSCSVTDSLAHSLICAYPCAHSHPPPSSHRLCTVLCILYEPGGLILYLAPGEKSVLCSGLSSLPYLPSSPLPLTTAAIHRPSGAPSSTSHPPTTQPSSPHSHVNVLGPDGEACIPSVADRQAGRKGVGSHAG